VECFLELIQKLPSPFPLPQRERDKMRVSCDRQELEFWLTEKDIHQAKEFLIKTGIHSGFIVIHPGVPARE